MQSIAHVETEPLRKQPTQENGQIAFKNECSQHNLPNDKPSQTEEPKIQEGDSSKNENYLICELEGHGKLQVPVRFIDLHPASLASTLLGLFEQMSPEKQSKILKASFPGTSADNMFNSENDLARAFEGGAAQFMSHLLSGKLEPFYAEEHRIGQLLDKYFYDTLVHQNYRKAVKIQRAVKKPQNDIRKPNDSSEPDWQALRLISSEEVLAYGLQTEESVKLEDAQNNDELGDSKSAPGDKSDPETKFQEAEIRAKTTDGHSADNIASFHEQERERYANPTQSYVYKLPNGEPRWVAPVCKKAMDSSVRPRDHFLLLPERPSAVTILSLVRDAASKLPQGYGTRSDICDLLRESQYINPQIDEEKMSSVVSGALDRLHYENNPCVRFDIGRKLWIYLHWPKEEGEEPVQEQEPGEQAKLEKVIKNKKVKNN